MPSLKIVEVARVAAPATVPSVKIVEVARVAAPATMPSVKIVEVARVVVPASKPPRPCGESLLRLSALDAPWLINPLIQRVLLFDDGDGQLPPFASLVASLRASLAATLARFLPLAGRIVFLPSTGDVTIDCSCSESEDGGVRFLVAEMDGAHAGKLAGDARHDVDTFQRLVPELDVPALPAEALAVQVTRLTGGVAVGVSFHHAVVDGRSVLMFLDAWAAACRGDAVATAAPTFDRSSVAFHGGEELARSTLRKYAPDLPMVPPLRVSPTCPRRTFTLGEKHIARLKERIARRLRPASSPDHVVAPSPSSFVAVAALAWVSFVQAKHPAAISADADVYLFFFVDCRGRRGIDPPVSENYFGTCIAGCLAKATARDLLAEDGLAAAAATVRREVRRATEDPLALRDWATLAVSSLPLDRLVSMSGSTRFRAYEAADFGWGMPSRTELVTMNNGGQVVVVAARGGGVQASVCMQPEHMEAFRSHFMNYSN